MLLKLKNPLKISKCLRSKSSIKIFSRLYSSNNFILVYQLMEKPYLGFKFISPITFSSKKYYTLYIIKLPVNYDGRSFRHHYFHSQFQFSILS